jgi:hypothetical protein
MKSKTLIIILVSMIGVVGLVVAIGIVSTQNRNKVDTAPNPTEPVVTETPTQLPTFGETDSLKEVLAGPLHKKTPIDFVSVGDQLAYMDQDSALAISDSALTKTIGDEVLSIHSTTDGTIVNNRFEPVVVTPKGDTKPLPKNIINMIPYEQEYLYLEFNSTTRELVINKTDNILIAAKPQEVGRVQLEGILNQAELREIGGAVYIFVYPEETKENIEIWQFEGTNVRKIRTLNNVRSFSYHKDLVLFTDDLEQETDLTTYKTNILDLKNPLRPSIQEIPWTQILGQNDIYGDILAERCAMDEEGTKIYCVVKKDDVPHDLSDYEDKLFSYDIKTRKLKILYNNIRIYASRVYISPKGEIHILDQQSGKLYKFVN